MQWRAALLLSSVVVSQVCAQDPVARPESVRALDTLPATPSVARKLDLRLPDIRAIFSQEVIDQALSRTRDTIEEVEVEGARPRIVPSSPAVPGGLLAPFWAFAHPTQAWRILAPLPPDRAQLVASTPPDATDSARAAPRPRGIAIGD
jgi:hypothetical protein